ncbi:fimbrial protein [Providencia vermicola]|uniref:Fimbrial protein n=1 Tax=Providencia vermicola TaxID=333965 RepID=A0AAX3S3V0_9GAMM|nr:MULTISPECIES: fimbrial protein [Providencia]ELX8379816.1 type 1 fimbrial protein [Providencia stuartii]EMD5259206.1 type 1 fimbrial protein [Providencia stuartii]USB38315.1 type 1 fimbrial protein [Providencia vermicola]WFC07251.1 fimbrial protein [Providencia vermicola]
MNNVFIVVIMLVLMPKNAFCYPQLDVQFRGELVHSKCQIAIESVNKQIKLDNLRWQYINEYGASEIQPFFIAINKCSQSDLNKTIRFTWQSQQLTNIGGHHYLMTQGQSGALLGITEANKNNQLIVWNQPIDIGVVSVVNDQQQLTFGVFVRKPATEKIKVGDFKGTATFSVEYE